jgi:two-component system response regulator WspF
MRIAIVNDLSSAIALLKQVLQTVPDYQIVWTARDGAEAVAKCAQDRPDLILMDLQMIGMDGVEATKRIMKQSPCGILIVMPSAERTVDKVYAAIEHGALDVADLPDSSSGRAASDLLQKITKVSKLLRKPSTTKASKTTSSFSSSFDRRSGLGGMHVPLIAIGSSTGGPKALATILSRLPADFSAAITIVQHVDAHFSAGLVDWLGQQTRLPVRIARAGDRFEKGTVLVAGTNDHLYLKPDLTLDYTADPIDYSYRPSVDVFFKSLAQHWKRKDTAVLLTGMGRDGGEGMSVLRQHGWHTIAQDKDSCVVFGMPKAAIELNAAIDVLSPDAIASSLLRNLSLTR